MSRNNILADVTLAYGHSRENYERAAGRGDFDRADEAVSEMQEIERCITIIETSTSWRKSIAARLKRQESRR